MIGNGIKRMERSKFNDFYARTPVHKARMEHLESLQLDLTGKRVLEVGAGIGLLTEFFEKKNCSILSIEGREENVKEFQRKFPHRRIEQLDLETDCLPQEEFDIVFAYGILYHLTIPEKVLEKLSSVCKEVILLDACICLGDTIDVILVKEPPSMNQSLRGMGCRPTRPWVMDKLKKYWGYAYVSRTQPRHYESELNWIIPILRDLYRAVFVGSKNLIENKNLLTFLPKYQEYVNT